MTIPCSEHVVCGRCGQELVPLEPHTCPTSFTSHAPSPAPRPSQPSAAVS